MADDPGDKKQQEQNLELRRALSDAYTFVEGAKSIQTFAAITFEELLDQQIELISGTGTDVRPNKLVRIDQIENNLKSSIAQVKALPPDAFAEPDPASDVNTPADEEDPDTSG